MQYRLYMTRFSLVLASTLLLTCAITTRGGDDPVPAVPPAGDRFTNDTPVNRKICLVCDASATMKPKLAIVVDQLRKAIASLRPIQSFTIIFFQDRDCLAFKSGKFVPATPENKRDAEIFLSLARTTEKTDPMPGLELAFKDKPNVIYLLADHDFPSNDAVLKKIRELNKDTKAKIHAIALISDSDKDTAFFETLETIARETGGKFKLTKTTDLEEQPAPPATRPAKDAQPSRGGADTNR